MIAGYLFFLLLYSPLVILIIANVAFGLRTLSFSIKQIYKGVLFSVFSSLIATIIHLIIFPIFFHISWSKGDFLPSFYLEYLKAYVALTVLSFMLFCLGNFLRYLKNKLP